MGDGQEEEGNTPSLPPWTGTPEARTDLGVDLPPFGEDLAKSQQPSTPESPPGSNIARGLQFLVQENAHWLDSEVILVAFSLPSVLYTQITSLPLPSFTSTPAQSPVYFSLPSLFLLLDLLLSSSTTPPFILSLL
jgi:hypothetical protein